MSKDQLTLAPAAGEGIMREVAKILLARPDFIKDMADALHNALHATRRTWDSASKEWVEEPDTRSQLQAFFGCVCHMEGEPIKRVFHQHTSDGKVDPQTLLQESPATLEAMERLIAKAKWRQSGRNGAPKQAEQVLDVG